MNMVTSLSLSDIAIDKPFLTGIEPKIMTMQGAEHPTAMTSDDTPMAMTEVPDKTASETKSTAGAQQIMVGAAVVAVFALAYWHSKRK